MANAVKLTQEDVWGKWSEAPMKKLSDGMIVAQGYPMSKKEYDNHPRKEDFRPRICPVWKDVVPYKSVTVICQKEQQQEVEAWLIYVHGGNCIEKSKELDGGRVAIRSNYMCW